MNWELGEPRNDLARVGGLVEWSSAAAVIFLPAFCPGMGCTVDVWGLLPPLVFLCFFWAYYCCENNNKT